MLGLVILAGAFMYRMRGGMPPSFPRPVDQMIFALPYGIAGFLACASVWMVFPYAPVVVGLLTFALTVGMLVRGHGNTMDLGKQDKKPEWYEFLIRGWLFDKVPLYWYDLVGHSISGLTYTLPVGIATLNPVLAFSGLLKGPAYALAKKGGANTEGGELLTGAVLWGVLLA